MSEGMCATCGKPAFPHPYRHPIALTFAPPPEQKLVTALRLVRADIATLYPTPQFRGGFYRQGYGDGYYHAVDAALRVLDRKIVELEEG